MVLISEDEYAQLQARTKPTEDVTESSVREHNNTEISSPSEISTKPSEVSEKSTQTETTIPNFPIQRLEYHSSRSYLTGNTQSGGQGNTIK